MPAARHLALLVFGLTLACSDSNPAASPYYDGETIEVWASDDLIACNGTFPYMEAWLSAFRDRVGQPDSTARHTFHWLSQEEFDASPCRADDAACAFSASNTIYSTFVPAEHELVHVELKGLPPSLIGEGAAEVFGSSFYYNLVTTPSIEAMANEPRIPWYGYQHAGRFSRFLIDRFGIDAYLDLYAALDGVRGYSGLAAGAPDVLGVELSSLVEEFEDRPTCELEAWRFYDVECSELEPERWRDADHWSTMVDLGCESLDVIGPSAGRVWVRRALYIEETDRYEMSIESEDASSVATLYSCDASCIRPEPWVPIPTFPVAYIGLPTTLELKAGHHWLRIEQDADGDGSPVTVRIGR